MIEYVVFGAAGVVIKKAVDIEYAKSKHIDLTEEEKESFLNDENREFIHFTTEKNARSIFKSGKIIPTKGIINNHFSTTRDNDGKLRASQKVYMFDSKTLSVEDYVRNLPRKNSPSNGCYTFYGISMKPNKDNIDNFKKRAFDGAITYEGEVELSKVNGRVAKYALDLDENNQYIMKEIGIDEEYTPSPELIAKVSKDRCGRVKYALRNFVLDSRLAKRYIASEREQSKINKKRAYFRANKQLIEEGKQHGKIANFGKNIVNKFKSIFSKFKKNDLTKALPEGKLAEDTTVDNGTSFKSELEQGVNSEKESVERFTTDDSRDILARNGEEYQR